MRLAVTVAGLFRLLKSQIVKGGTLIDNARTDSSACEDLCRILYISNLLHRSEIVRDLIKQIETPTGDRAAFLEQLGKVGEYYHGLHILWARFSDSYAQGEVALKFELAVLPTAPVNVPLETDVAELLRGAAPRFWARARELYLKNVDIDRTWESVTLPPELQTVYHCELRLVDALRGERITGGPLGVSEGSCVLCTEVLKSLNFCCTEGWHISRTHDNGYMGALPVHESFVKTALNSVVEAIRSTVDPRLREQRRQSLMSRPRSPSSDAWIDDSNILKSTLAGLKM